jgi:hypothetical protein
MDSEKSESRNRHMGLDYYRRRATDGAHPNGVDRRPHPGGRSRTAILLAACTIALAAAEAGAGAESNKPGEGPNVTAPQLSGSWTGMQCESAQGSTVARRRQFVMTESTWKIIAQAFGDTKCSPETLLYTIDFGGDYELGANSNTVPGARETRFSFTHKLVTPTAAGVDFLKQRCDQYPWAQGTVQDIAKNGCGKLFVSIEACAAEYDLTAIVDGTLRLGDRSHPLCTPDTRPTKLQALGFVRE